jgi:hypothetical protein
MTATAGLERPGSVMMGDIRPPRDKSTVAAVAFFVTVAS